jgi:hypothetical protein
LDFQAIRHMAGILFSLLRHCGSGFRRFFSGRTPVRRGLQPPSSRPPRLCGGGPLEHPHGMANWMRSKRPGLRSRTSAPRTGRTL